MIQEAQMFEDDLKKANEYNSVLFIGFKNLWPN
jgi:hypothetical protein